MEMNAKIMRNKLSQKLWFNKTIELQFQSFWIRDILMTQNSYDCIFFKYISTTEYECLTKTQFNFIES